MTLPAQTLQRLLITKAPAYFSDFTSLLLHWALSFVLILQRARLVYSSVFYSLVTPNVHTWPIPSFPLGICLMIQLRGPPLPTALPSSLTIYIYILYGIVYCYMLNMHLSAYKLNLHLPTEQTPSQCSHCAILA